MKFVVCARTSRDEDEGGQDVRAQGTQVQADVEAAGHDVAAVLLDEDVSGSVPCLERRGFMRAHEMVLAGEADRIAMRDWSRFSRRHPFRAGSEYLDLLAAGVVVEVTRDRALPEHVDEDEWDLVECITGSVALSDTYGYRHSVRKNTQHAMTDLKEGRRQTRSGKPVGRPQKVNAADVERFYPIACEVGPTEAARRLSVEKGWSPDQDPRTQRKYRVGHSTLITAFKREGRPWPPAQGGPA